jgi:hypothetical protein
MLLRSVTNGIKSLLRPDKRNAEIEAEVRSFSSRPWNTRCGKE